MRQRPLLSLAGCPSSAQVTAVLVLLASLCSAQSPSTKLDVELGKRIYREGILPSGRPLRGLIRGDTPIEGTQLNCATCHRRSGFGSSEGGTLVPPIAGPLLYQPTLLRQADLFGRLFEEDQPVQFRARMLDLPVRPAYTDRTLAIALREGKDPTGRKLDTVMPRYSLSDDEMADLVAYLKLLASRSAPGVNRSAIHFATVVTEGVDADKRQVMLDVMEAYFHWKNTDTQGELQRRGRSPWYKEDFYRAYREWVFHVWELRGPKDTWRDQLKAYYQKQPVFALLSGISAGTWQPVHEFCEQAEVPCLFPNTDLPEVSGTDDYSVYFSKGLTGEAEALACYLHDHSHVVDTTRIVQVYRDIETSLTPARTLRRALQDFGLAPPHERIIKGAQHPTLTFWKNLFQRAQPSLLVAWLDDSDLESLEHAPGPVDAIPHTYLSYSLVKEPSRLKGPRDKIYLTYPFAVPDQPVPPANRVRGWLRSRGLTPKYEQIQFDTYFTLTLVDYSLARLVENFSRDYFIETIERETETSPNPGVFPHLSLGPGQRFASKGCYIVKLSAQADGGVKTVSDWIIP